jgi:butyryl-CoA dehydrogenase
LDFNPCTKHKAVRKTVRKFAETELGPISHEIDRDSRFPWEVIEKMGPLNYFGLQVPKKYGGAGLDTVSYAITIEEISRVCAAIGLCVTVHNSVGAYPIVLFGTEEQKERFLPLLASGEYIGAFCLTEANAGSDAGAVETTAVYDDGEYVVNGTKVFVTNGGVCGLAHIFAITDPDNPRSGASVFMVEKGMSGFAVGELEDLCGMRANPVSSLFLEDVRLPASHMLGRPGDGLKIGLSALENASSLKNRFHPFRPSRTIWPTWPPRLTPHGCSCIVPAPSRMPASLLAPRPPWPSFTAAPPPPG